MPPGRERRVDSRHQPEPRGFFVSGRPVDLPREKQPRHPLRLERRAQLGRIDVVVLDRVARADHLRVFEAGDRADHVAAGRPAGSDVEKPLT